MTHHHALCAAILGLGALLSSPAPAAEFEARVIVKLKAASPLKQAQAASRVRSLGARLGVSARMLGQPAPDLQVMQASGISSEALAARLAQQADVEYAVPDRIKTIRALPTDPLLGNQWYLQAPGITQPAAIDAVGAWSLTGGSASVVVAVVDTGVRFDHEDLAAPCSRATTSSRTASTPATVTATATPTPLTPATTSPAPISPTRPCAACAAPRTPMPAHGTAPR